MIPPKRGTFLRLQVFESVRISLNEVYGKGREICHFDLKGLTERSSFMAVTPTPTPFLVNVYNFFRGFSCLVSLTARCVCEAAGFYYTNNSTQFTCTFTSWKITCHDNCQKYLSVRALERQTSIWVPDFEKIRLSVWSMSRLSSSLPMAALPMVNILTPMRARTAKYGWNAMVRSLLF